MLWIFFISLATRGNIFSKKGSKRQSLTSKWKSCSKYAAKGKRNLLYIAKVRFSMLEGNSLSQRNVAKPFKCSTFAVNEIINIDLNLEKEKYLHFHYFSF